jgi:L-2-hydroxyglutarate oxidase LhgO
VTENVDALVIGAGVIGLAVARALAQAGREVILVDRAEAFGTVTSSRNSEVIHAGIYYPTGSLKARLCVAGRRALYAYCRQHGIGHRQCGKLIVATDQPGVAKLEALADKARANGVEGLELLEAADALAMEPALTCTAALHSPVTGILDSHGFMLSLLGEAEAAGAMLALHAPVEAITVGERRHRVIVGGAEPMALDAALVVNAAGHGAPVLARRTDGLPAHAVPQAFYAKGTYFGLTGRAPFSRLIYPMPEDGGLGVHLTLDLGGQARFGPDVEWVDRADDYDVDPARAEGFYGAIRTYWPALPDGALVPGYVGVRPKLQAPGEPAADFVIQGPADHGVDGLVNLYGIESPGLTASLAVAEEVLARLDMGAPVALAGD